MPDYDNNMKGVLFKNDKRETDRHPDYKGSAEVNGVECWLSAWIKTSAKGEKYMSLQFEVKDAPQQQVTSTGTPPVPTPAPRSGLADDDIPF